MVFHNWVVFGTILEGLRNFGGGGFEPPNPPSVRHWQILTQKLYSNYVLTSLVDVVITADVTRGIIGC